MLTTVRRISVVAVIIAAVCVGTWLAVGRRANVKSRNNVAMNSGAPAFPVQVVDLRNWSPVRSDEAAANPSGEPLKLHRGLLALAIYLPMGSPPGKYEIEIQRIHGETLLRVAGTAGITSGNTILNARVDLSKFQPGQYSLGIRQRSWEWRYYSFSLR